MSQPYQNGYDRVLRLAGLEKTAARKETKILRRLVGDGKVDEAERFAKKLFSRGKDVQGYTPREHIQQLGAGREGVADLVTSPKRGLEVLKQYNPHSDLVNNRMLDRKKDFFQKMQALDHTNPHDVEVAKFFGEKQVGNVHPLRSFRHEYVPGKSVGSLRKPHREAINEIEAKAKKAVEDGDIWHPRNHPEYGEMLDHKEKLRKIDEPLAKQQQEYYERAQRLAPREDPQGSYVPTDMMRGHGNNTIIDARTGKKKIIDTMPLMRNKETLATRPGNNPTRYMSQGDVTIYDADPFTRGPNVAMDGLTGGQLKAYAHRGVHARPGAGEVPVNARGSVQLSRLQNLHKASPAAGNRQVSGIRTGKATPGSQARTGVQIPKSKEKTPEPHEIRTPVFW